MRQSGNVGQVEPHDGLVLALDRARAALDPASFALPTPAAEAAVRDAGRLVRELDGGLLPRLRRADTPRLRLRRAEAPVVAVVSGSTGVGKSTLVNSLIRAPVSPAGVLRPTTRTPLLFCHPQDGPAIAAWAAANPPVQTILAPLLPPGLSLLDAPDLDSVVEPNRRLAHDLLTGSDIWILVTSPARYADAEPWRVLVEARDRDIPVAVVLDRVPDEIMADVAADLSRLLASAGLSGTPLFAVPESTLPGNGLLPEAVVAPLRAWLTSVASSPVRQRVAQRALQGSVVAVARRLEALARAADEQQDAAVVLEQHVRSAYAEARSEIESVLRRGALLPPGPDADRGRVDDELLADLTRALATLVVEVNAAAVHRVRTQWEADRTGRALLAQDGNLGQPWTGLAVAVHAMVKDWQAGLYDRARHEPVAPERAPANARLAAAAALGSAAGLGAAAGARTRSNDQYRCELGDWARADLLARIEALLDQQAGDQLAPLAAAGVDAAARLRSAALGLRTALARATVGPGRSASVARAVAATSGRPGSEGPGVRRFGDAA